MAANLFSSASRRLQHSLAECGHVYPARRAWIAAVADQPILTLSNYADFTADGGVIGAYRVGSDWRFDVNLEVLAALADQHGFRRVAPKPETTGI